MVDENIDPLTGEKIIEPAGILIKFPTKIYSEEEVKKLWDNAKPHPDLKPYVNRADRGHFPPISRQKPDGYFIALHFDKIVAHCGWKKLDHIYLGAGSKTHPDYVGRKINNYLREKRRNIFGSNPAMLFLNNTEQWWLDSFLKVGWEVVDELPEPYKDMAPPDRIYLLYNKDAAMQDDKANKSFDKVFNDILKVNK